MGGAVGFAVAFLVQGALRMGEEIFCCERSPRGQAKPQKP
jgi:hypothetical protein